MGRIDSKFHPKIQVRSTVPGTVHKKEILGRRFVRFPSKSTDELNLTLSMPAPPTGKPLENLSHKVVDPLYSFPRFTTSEMKEDHLFNQQTTSTVTIQAPKIAHAYHSYDVNHDGDISHAQRTSPSKSSRSIMIKRNGSLDEFDSSSVSASTKQMYDWATWRMYYRITSARQKRSAIMPLMDVPSSGLHSDSLTYRSLDGYPKEAMGDYTVHGGLAAVDDGSDEGVFVMDM